MSDVNFIKCDSCERTNSPDNQPEKMCGPTRRYFVQLSGSTTYCLDVCNACAVQRTIKTLEKLAHSMQARALGRPEPEPDE